MEVATVTKTAQSEYVRMRSVYTDATNNADNTFAAATPVAWCELLVDRPAQFGAFVPGQKYHVDFTLRE